jgi:hypothetical protein
MTALATPAAATDVDLYLQRRNADGTWSGDLATGGSSSLESETLEFGRLAPGTYRLEVHNWAGPPGNEVAVLLTFFDSGPKKAARSERPAPQTDETAPAATLSGRRSQDLGRRVVVRVACEEACTALGKGRVRIARSDKKRRLKRATTAIAAGESAKLRLAVPRKTRRAARRALRNGKRVRAKLTVVTTDAAGNESRSRRTVRLTR